MTTSRSGQEVLRLNIIIADADSAVAEHVLKTLREAGHAVFHAYDLTSAIQLATSLNRVDVVLTNTFVIGGPGIELVHQLRARMPKLPIIYLASNRLSTPAIEAELPRDVPILREPYPADAMRNLVMKAVSGQPSGDASQ